MKVENCKAASHPNKEGNLRVSLLSFVIGAKHTDMREISSLKNERRSLESVLIQCKEDIIVHALMEHEMTRHSFCSTTDRDVSLMAGRGYYIAEL